MHTVTIIGTVRPIYNELLDALKDTIACPEFVQIIKQPRGVILQTTDIEVANYIRKRMRDPIVAGGRVMEVDGEATLHWKHRRQHA